VTSSWLEVERAKVIPETSSIIFAQKVSHPKQRPTHTVVSSLPFTTAHSLITFVTCGTHSQCQDASSTPNESLQFAFRRMPSEVPLSADVHSNAFNRFGKFLKHYFGHLQSPQSPVPSATRRSPSSKTSSLKSATPPSVATPRDGVVTCGFEKSEAKTYSSKSPDASPSLTRSRRSGKDFDRRESDSRVTSPTTPLAEIVANSLIDFRASHDVLPKLSISPRIHLPPTSRESSAPLSTDSSHGKSPVQVSVCPHSHIQSGPLTERVPRLHSKPEYHVHSLLHDEKCGREAMGKSATFSGQRDSAASLSQRFSMVQSLLEKERTLAHELGELQKVE
jgi:hypothetical protein